MQGHPSTGMRILGGLMVALAIAIAATAAVFAPVLLNLATAITTLTGTNAIIATTATVAVPSATIAAIGFGIFAKGAKQTGLSKTMNDVNKERIAAPEASISPAR